MLQIAKRKRVTLKLLSRLETLSLHWSGRSLICGRMDCPMCVYERPRTKCYCMARMNEEVGLLEMQSTLRDLIHKEMEQRNMQSPAGLTMILNRSSQKRPWQCTEAKVFPVDYMPPTRLIEEAASLFRVPDTTELTTWPQFVIVAAAAHRGLLRGATLPFEEPLSI